MAIVAAAARAHGLPFVCVPAGTRNHFAKDLGVDPHDLVGSLDALVDGVERRIDVAEVNGRLFLNNVSLGIYGDAVRQEQYRDEKARTLFETARAVLGPSASLPELRLVDDLGREHRSPAVVLVSNNPYALDRPLAAGTRRTLDSGELGIVVLDAPATRSMPGRAWASTSFEVSGPAPVHAGVDGEAADLSPPLQFAILRPRCASGSPPDIPASHRRDCSLDSSRAGDQGNGSCSEQPRSGTHTTEETPTREGVKPRISTVYSTSLLPYQTTNESPYGAPWLQPVATGCKSRRRANRVIKPKPLPRVAPGFQQRR